MPTLSGDIDRLKDAFAPLYRLERELGRGGMATVYLAEDLKHHRQVAIKVLKPELTASLGAERFLREISIAAKLNHPNILMLIDSGDGDGFLYYVMPYVTGESLRARLNREPQLPLDDALQIAREVAGGLGHAHAQDVVHRDIKPENILFDSGRWVITDFGVARAVTTAGGEKLTETGIAVGTPHYMSPEQASGAAVIDSRADIYALGCVVYEMLGGEPPFTGPSAQAILARHAVDPVPNLRTIRNTMPEGVVEAIERALNKSPADRYSSAEAFADALDAGRSAGQPRWQHPLALAGLSGLASLGVLGVVYVLMLQLGLPDWVFTAAIVLLAVGLPFVTLTGHLERRRARALRTSTIDATPHPWLRGWFTWRRVIISGGLALAGLAVVTATYMAMRAFGIGPVGTLVATGVLGEREPVVLAEFTDRTGDSTLAAAVTEAFRIDLGQSSAFRLARPAGIARALEQMNRDPATPLDLALAREIAVRGGLKAVIGGEINAIGNSYVLSVRVVAPESGEDLAALRETTRDETEVIPAIDRLSKRVRERIGESLRTIRASRPLVQVATPSLPALRKVTEAFRARHRDHDLPRAIALLEEAVAIDSGFAWAWRELAAIQGNLGNRAARIEASRRAFLHRDRLQDYERYLVTYWYYWQVEGDLQKAIPPYRALLQMRDTNEANNLGIIHASLRQFDEAERIFAWMTEHDRFPRLAYQNLARVQLNQGKFAAAAQSIDALAERLPGVPWIELRRSQIAVARGDYEQAEMHLRTLREAQRADPYWQGETSRWLGDAAQLRGKLAEAERSYRAAMGIEDDQGRPRWFLINAIYLSALEVLFRDRRSRAIEVLESALQQHPLADIPPLDRPYLELAWFYAAAGRPELARDAFAEYEREVGSMMRGSDGAFFHHRALGNIALAEGRPEEAIKEFRLMDNAPFFAQTIGALAGLGHAYDLAGNSDSAIAVYERYLNTPSAYDPPYDDRSSSLARIYRRLGELYEARGEPEEAVQYYGQFVELWRNADPELQPLVEDARNRMVQLIGESRAVH